MKRLIDEEDAIRAICKNCYAEDGGDYKDCRYYPCDDVQAIEALPSTDLERIKDIMKKANEQDNHIGRPTDIISRADAIEAVSKLREEPDKYYTQYNNGIKHSVKALSALPSSEAKPSVIRSKTLLPTKDFKEWAKRIREVNPNAVVIPCDAEVVSAEAVQGWIPCSERLPEDLEAVNVTWVNHNPPVYYQYTKDVPNTDTAVYYRGVWYWWDSTICDVLGEYGEKCGAEQIDKDIEILAWMPLPKPYKGGDDE